MRGPKATSIAQKKLDPAGTIKKSKGNENVPKKEKAASKKNSGAPKRPASAFFVFMEEFRKTYKENFPDNKSIAVVRGDALYVANSSPDAFYNVGKAGGEKWKSMSDAEKAPYVAKAGNRKAEYEIALKDFKNLNENNGNEKPEGSEKSSSEVHDDAEQEASS